MKEDVMRSKALKTVGAVCVVGAAFLLTIAVVGATTAAAWDCSLPENQQLPECQTTSTTTPTETTPTQTTTMPEGTPEATTTATVPITNLPPKGEGQKKSSAPADQPSTGSSTANGQLPFTGVNADLLALAGAVLLFAGLAVVKLERGK